MQSSAQTPEGYIESLPNERRAAVQQLREIMQKHLPKGFEEVMQYGMIGYVVPHTRYPAGYHCNPSDPLPFLGIASQKNHISLYHMGLYSSPELLDWFIREHGKHATTKLDMWKSCIRWKNPDQIPFALIAQLAAKMTPEAWINLYEKNIKR